MTAEQLAGHGIIATAGYCWWCLADWAQWAELDAGKRAAMLERFPQLEWADLDQGCCPVCGAAFAGEEETERGGD